MMDSQKAVAANPLRRFSEGTLPDSFITGHTIDIGEKTLYRGLNVRGLKRFSLSKMGPVDGVYMTEDQKLAERYAKAPHFVNMPLLHELMKRREEAGSQGATKGFESFLRQEEIGNPTVYVCTIRNLHIFNALEELGESPIHELIAGFVYFLGKGREDIGGFSAALIATGHEWQNGEKDTVSYPAMLDNAADRMMQSYYKDGPSGVLNVFVQKKELKGVFSEYMHSIGFDGMLYFDNYRDNGERITGMVVLDPGAMEIVAEIPLDSVMPIPTART
jgi:hypothetical protein